MWRKYLYKINQSVNLLLPYNINFLSQFTNTFRCLNDKMAANKIGKPFGFMNLAKVITVVHENPIKSHLQREQLIFYRLTMARKFQPIFIPYNIEQ